MSAIDAVVGLDIGTTTSKALIRPLESGNALVAEVPTRWQSPIGQHTEIAPSALLSIALDLLAGAVERAETRWGPIAVRAVSVTGLGESGVLIDPRGGVDTPAIAWFDRRGETELATLAARAPRLMADFAGLTGLPWSFQASLAKLLWLTGRRPIAAGSRWLSVPEWIVHALGGEQVREASLASRTGLIRQDTGHVWDELADLAGLPAGLLPEPVAAGTAVGKLARPDLPATLDGALLSVAGHDHPVAALAVGATGPDDLFNSAGTADVLARSVTTPLTRRAREAIVAAGWSAGAHVLPGADLLLGGGSGGLLLRRVLTMLGGDAVRDDLDRASLDVTAQPPGLSVSGDGRERDDVEIRLRDDATPATVWAAATAYTAELIRAMLADVEPIVGPHGHAVAAGGWTRLAGVRAARAAAVPRLVFRDLDQPGATGAALLAEHSLTADTRPLGDFLRTATARHEPRDAR